ncbi:MAG TPA: wax ester/triacylglycerol synthase family O-acyltransferase [Thermoleophilaceae bacterium]|jgi:WS/DGAT/MGAT family acyltransferase
MAEALSPSDLSAVQAERGPVHMHVGGVLLFEGAVGREAVARRIAERIHLIPRYAMRLESPPLGIANPVWVPDEAFDPDRHVRRAALPAPGGDAELCELVGHAMSEPLDRSRPLWQLVVVEGLAGGRSALVAKMHHALVDGIAAVDVSTVVLDPTPEGLDLPAPDEPATREAGPAARVEQLARVAAAQLAVPRRLAREAVSRALATDPRTVAGQARRAGSVLAELARVRPAAPATRLNRPIGRERLFALARASLDDVKAVRRAAGATVNDVLLGAVSLALSEYLGADAPERAVALVPVSVRGEADQGELGNRISTVFCDLPLRGDPLDRVRAISAEMTRAKGSSQVRAGALIVGATGLAPPIVSSLAVRAMSGPRVFNLVVSNVPGPQQTFYLAGVPLREVFPAVPLNPRNQALSIGIVSYDGRIGFGLLADRDALPDAADAAAAVESGVAALVEAAG